MKLIHQDRIVTAILFVFVKDKEDISKAAPKWRLKVLIRPSIIHVKCLLQFLTVTDAVIKI